MNKALINLFFTLMNQKCFGGKHTPEKKIIISKTKWLNAKERKQFNKEYKKAVNDGLIIRLKKKTKKGTGWHISVNAKMKKELMEIIENGKIL